MCDLTQYHTYAIIIFIMVTIQPYCCVVEEAKKWEDHSEVVHFINQNVVEIVSSLIDIAFLSAKL